MTPLERLALLFVLTAILAATALFSAPQPRPTLAQCCPASVTWWWPWGRLDLRI